MAKIFISYRRETAAGQARALFGDLVARFGRQSVVMDVDSFALGRDFRTELQKVLDTCEIMLVLIDRPWIDAKDETGKRRLDDVGDFVRLEVETALKRDIMVTPILLGGATVPDPDDLPATMRDLAYRGAFEIGHHRWESDVHELLRRLVPEDGGQNRRGPSVIQSIIGASDEELPRLERRIRREATASPKDLELQEAVDYLDEIKRKRRARETSLSVPPPGWASMKSSGFFRYGSIAAAVLLLFSGLGSVVYFQGASRVAEVPPARLPDAGANSIRAAQDALGLPPDGNLGDTTLEAIREFQRGLNARDPEQWPRSSVDGQLSGRAGQLLTSLSPMPPIFLTPFERAYLGNAAPADTRLTTIEPQQLVTLLGLLGMTGREVSSRDAAAVLSILRAKQLAVEPGKSGTLDSKAFERLLGRVPKRFVHGSGSFEQRGDAWIETQANQSGNLTFQSQGIVDGYLYLVDSTRVKDGDRNRPFTIRIPVAGGMAQSSYPNPYVWQDLYVVRPDN